MTIKNAFGILFYVLASIIIFGLCMLGFWDINQVIKTKLILASVLIIISTTLLLIGKAITKLPNWRLFMATSILSAVTAALITITLFICILLTPKLSKIISAHDLFMFDDLLFGTINIILITNLGFLLLKKSKTSREKYLLENDDDDEEEDENFENTGNAISKMNNTALTQNKLVAQTPAAAIQTSPVSKVEKYSEEATQWIIMMLIIPIAFITLIIYALMHMH